MNPIKPLIHRVLVPLLVTLLALAGGCVTVPKPDPAQPPHLADNSAYIVHVSGVSGPTIFDLWWLDGLRAAGATDDWTIYDWIGDRGMFHSLDAIDENHRIADDIAAYITALRRANPHARIIMSSESGGTAMIIWTLEKLPPDVHVDSVMLLQPDISPGYDLSAAMAHVDRHLFYTTSILDFGTLGFWTHILGTMDGVKSAGAGFVGFRPPAGADAAAYHHVVRIRWNLLDLFFIHPGSHSTALSPLYARFVLGPKLAEDTKNGK